MDNNFKLNDDDIIKLFKNLKEHCANRGFYHGGCHGCMFELKDVDVYDKSMGSYITCQLMLLARSLRHRPEKWNIESVSKIIKDYQNLE